MLQENSLQDIFLLDFDREIFHHENSDNFTQMSLENDQQNEERDNDQEKELQHLMAEFHAMKSTDFFQEKSQKCHTPIPRTVENSLRLSVAREAEKQGEKREKQKQQRLEEISAQEKKFLFQINKKILDLNYQAGLVSEQRYLEILSHPNSLQNEHFFDENQLLKLNFEQEINSDFEEDIFLQLNAQEDANSEPGMEAGADVIFEDQQMSEKEKKRLSRKIKKKAKKFSHCMQDSDSSQTTIKSNAKKLIELQKSKVQVEQGFIFPYRMVSANNFGLNSDEILRCNDDELESWASLSRAFKLSDEVNEGKTKKIFERKVANIEYKNRILKSLSK
ncbi:MAG: KRRI-Interacting protein 1, partial [Paramarteilia canceri]